MKSAWFWRIVAIIFICSLALVRLGDGQLFQTDEGLAAYRSVSLSLYHSMLVTYDDPFFPQFNKPPLLYWVVALFFRILGFNLWAVRLPTALASIGVSVLLYLIHRRYFNEWVALLSAVLLFSLPFYLFHVRTAMLEMPLMFFVLLTVYLLAYARPACWVAAAAGVACASAFMVKGAAALIALPAAVVVALMRHRFTLRTWWHVPVFCLGAVLPLLAYCLLLPHEYAHLFVESLFRNENSGTLSRIALSDRWPVLYRTLREHLLWHLPAAGGGLILFMTGVRKNVRVLEWLALGLLLSVPTSLFALKMVYPFSRYFLILYPFIVLLSVLFSLQVTRLRWTTWLLLPFMVCCPFIEKTIWAWMPVTVAIVVLILAHLPWFTAWRFSSPLMQAALLLAVAIPSSFSVQARGAWEVNPSQRPDPVAIRFSEKARDLLREGDMLVYGGRGYNKHDIYFYSRRPCVGVDTWLREHFEPGAETVGIFYRADLTGIPGVRTSVIDQDGPWKLLRICVNSNAVGVRGIVLAEGGCRRSIENALKLLSVQYTGFPKGFIVTGLPDSPVTPCPHDWVEMQVVRVDENVSESCPKDGVVTLDKSHALDLCFTSCVSLCGINLVRVSRRDDMTGLKVAVADPSSNAWHEVYALDNDSHELFDIKNGRLREVRNPALRMRFGPIPTKHVRILTSEAHPVRLQVGDVYIASGSQEVPAALR